MQSRSLLLLSLAALWAVFPALGGDIGVRPADGGDTGVRPAGGGDTGARPADGGDTGVRPAEGESAPAAKPGMAPDKQEFIDLMREIRQARAELRRAPDVVEIQKRADALPNTPENLAARRKIQAEARTLVETRLREIPGMTEKLRRLAELAAQFRADLPETAAREGKRLPKTAEKE